MTEQNQVALREFERNKMYPIEIDLWEEDEALAEDIIMDELMGVTRERRPCRYRKRRI
ncbi:MAG: hypothetical protein FWF38_00425 [Spirochaetaceae bacterium]|nr:hypothetical protein [Spirochaetaceae bacterium]